MRPPIVRVLVAALLVASSVTLPSLVAPDEVAAVNPSPSAPMAMRLEAGRHTGYTFSSSGAITGSQPATVSAATTVQATHRSFIGTRGVFLRMSTGPMAGYWIRESMVAHIIGATAVRRFDPPRAIAMPVGTVLGYKFSTSWDLISAPVKTFTSASSATATRSAAIHGVTYYLIADGPLANSWVPSGGTDVARTLACRTGPRAGGGTAVWSRLTSAGAEVALTFDLGGRTEPAMAIAKRLLLHGVCATIFPTGDAASTTAGNAVLEFMDSYPAVFEFGNHTKDHCDLVSGGGDTGCPAGKPSASFIQSQLTSADATIFGITGQHTTPYWRPPYGAHDQAARLAASAVGYKKTVMWHIDTIDWRPQSEGGPTTVQIIDKVVGNAANGSIVLMHLGGWNTHAALPGMINGLRGRGFATTSISDLADGQ
jgi:peptidoglycan/xylan/chitin deacetylase (PgdA/CDA1 family)